MSSTIVTDAPDDRKTDNTLIIIVNNDGTISVDQETLQNILANQQTAVSVVRVGSQDDNSQDSNETCDSQNDGSPHVNLTVEGFYPPSEDAGVVDDLPATTASSTSAPAASPVATPMAPAVDLASNLVSASTPVAVVSASHSIGAVHSVSTPNPPEGESLDPFLEMDPEQLERLETALQSEQAKQILGENVTAMLDMLSVEEEATHMKDSILMDHCYTNRSPATAPPPPTPPVPIVTHQFPTVSGRDDSNTLLLHPAEHVQPVTTAGMGPPTIQTVIRGRGRGRPGRPRREGVSARGVATTTLRGINRGALSRGGMKIQRGGTIVSGTGASNMIMVQQIKQITPPLGTGGTSNASLVPVVRPLVFTTSSGTPIPAGTIVRTPVSGQVQKQIITVPQGARFVAVQSKPSSGETGGQQTVVLANAGSQVVQTQQIQGPISVSSQLAGSNNAKVVVAKMPVLPPQLLGAQPTTLPISDQPSQHLPKEDESDFTDFPREASEESETDESDVGSDDEYRDPTVGDRRRGRGGKGRGRFGRGARSRGGFRVYDSSRGPRGGRRGRGRGFVRLEDVDRVKKLDAEMAGFVAAMEKSPEHGSVPEKTSSPESREKHIKKEDQHVPPEINTVEGSKKKLMKVYGKSVKKILIGEDIQVKSEGVVKEKVEKLPTGQVSPEKKNVSLKHSLKRQSPEDSPTVPAPISTPVVNTVSPVTPLGAGDTRKNYPKRENRKPPAHLAEALGPALFSTPDIIRRVSTGSDPKTPQEVSSEEKEVKPLIAANPLTMTPEEKESVGIVESAEKDIPDPPQVMEDVVSAVADPFQSDVMNSEDILDPSLLLPVGNPEEKIIDKASVILKMAQEPTPVAPVDTPKPKLQSLSNQSNNVTKATTLKGQATVQAAVKRSSRRRNSAGAQQNETSVKKENRPVNIGPSKDKKKNEDKQKGRRRSSEVDEEDDEDVPSSDDASWNSEDDPDRLWCICKKPHNNRFMICCDVCEDWFHGKCVGVTKAMGQQMENKGLDWSCPNCSKKKENDERDSKKAGSGSSLSKEKELKKVKESKKDFHLEKNAEAVVHTEVKDSVSESEIVSRQESSAEEQIMYCIVCKKEARSSSIYCSDACILKHAQESLFAINKEKAAVPGLAAGTGSKDLNQEQLSVTSPSTHVDATQGGNVSSTLVQSQRPRSEARVVVIERKSGRVLAGPNAPTTGNLKTWLKDNPTFEVVRPGIMPTTKFYSAKLPTGKTLAMPSVKPPQKIIVSQAKTQVTNVSTPVASKQTTQKNNSIPPKTVLVQQKLSFTKLTVNQQKTISGPQASIKVNPPKTQKGAIVVPAQPQKVPVKASPKNPAVPSKTIAKSPAATSSTNIKIAQSPSSKTSPSAVVSKAPATSTVKEATKVVTEKTIVKKVEIKRQSSSSSDTAKKEDEKEKPSGPEPIRLNIRKTLQELLQARIQECSDLSVSESEVQSIANNIEEEMHLFFRDTGLKYKSKYRSLVFNIKDPKNLTLFRKIADKSLTPYQLVRLSPEELASQELALWREREAKHQLEMIKKNELELMSQAKTYVMKTHKGEQVIETDESLKVEVPELVDPSTVPDLVSPLNNSVSSTVEDTDLDKSKSKVKDKDSKEKTNKEEKERSKDREKSKHDDKRREKSEKSKRDERERKDSHHDRHDREKRRESRERDKSKSSSRDKHHKSKRDHDRHRDSKSNNSSSRSTSSSRKDKKDDVDVKREEFVKKEVVQPEGKEESEIESEIVNVKEEVKDESELRHEPTPGLIKEFQEDSDLSDREPSSTVIIKTPDINTEEQEKSVCATVWKGFVNMPDVAKFFTTVQVVSGDPQNLCNDLPDTVDIVGRISPETVWDYISKMKKTGTKEILVIRLTAASDEEKIPYITLYTYLNSRSRLGVVGNVSNMIKDFYIMPLASHLPVPQILLPLYGPGFEDYRPHLLIGILVRARRKRLAPENEYVAKMPKRIIPPPVSHEPVERSYTPPLPSGGNEAGSSTPPLYNTFYPAASGDSYTPPSSPQPFLTGPSLLSKADQRLSRIDDESLLDEYRLPDKPSPEKKSLASHVAQYGDDDDDDDDDDTPYSPGGSDDNLESSEENILLTPKNPVELQRKVEELNRKIEEQKQQIQNISSAIVASDPSVVALGTATDTLKTNSMMQNYILGSSGETVLEEGDENEAYSPSRSFTPPASIPFLGPADATNTPVFSKLTSDISLPSNLQEILATIKKQEAVGSKGINLKSDPIVQNYGKASDLESSQPKTPTEEFNVSASFATGVVTSGSSTAQSSSVLQSASSALLSLSTPVVHPLASGGSVLSTSVSAKVVDSKVSRDPRQRGSDMINKTSGSTLSSLSDDDLIKKALEMEMELTESKTKSVVADKSATVTVSTLQQPLPPGVDSLPTVSTSVLSIKSTSMIAKPLPPSQPLPPGVEDEEYPSYSSYSLTGQSTVIPPMNIPVPPMSPTAKYTIAPPSPAAYRVQHPYPSSSYTMGSSCGPPPSPGYTSSPSSSYPAPPHSGYPANIEDNNTTTSTGKRKFPESEGDDSLIKRDRSDSPPSGIRETWDNKVPVPVRGRFNGRGRAFGRGAPPIPRGFVRVRGVVNRSSISTPPPPPPPPQPPSSRSRWDTKEDRKRQSHYETNRSDWEPHGKDFDEKHRDRAREGRHRERSRERDSKTSSNQRSHSTRSSRSRESEKGSESP